jgi:Dolichyl-phosphate-mannose-protein mannosyltransferase
MAAVALGALSRLALVGAARTALFWDSGSYLGVAKNILARGFPPPLGLRPPGYPLFILATGWGGPFLGGTVIAQHLLGVATTVLLYLILARITQSRLVGLVGALAFSVMPDVLFMEVTIYSETLAMFLVTSCAFLMVRHGNRPGSPAGWLLCGIVVAVATWTRPITVVLIPVVTMAVLASEPWRCRGGRGFLGRLPTPTDAAARLLAVFLLPVVLLTGGLVMWNGVIAGGYRLSNGLGSSSLDYVGHPSIYNNLPPDLQWISRTYEKLEPGRKHWLPYIPWGRALEPLLEARRQQGLPTADWDAAALDTTLRAIRARPVAYLSIWLATLKSYWCTYQVQYGLWRSYSDLGRPHRIQVGPTRRNMVGFLEAMWQRLQPVVSLLCVLALPAACLDRLRERPLRRLVGWLWAAVVVGALVNTAVESALGQFRYRMIWSPLILVLALYTLTFLGRALVTAAAELSSRGRRHGRVERDRGGMFNTRPSSPVIEAYADRCLARPAYQKVVAAEG